MEYEVEGTRPRGRPKKTWTEIVEKDCKARGLNREDAVDATPFISAAQELYEDRYNKIMLRLHGNGAFRCIMVLI